ncbi:MAG: hypothetical protein WCT18_02935 [Patescibacteria group bacterium]
MDDNELLEMNEVMIKTFPFAKDVFWRDDPLRKFFSPQELAQFFLDCIRQKRKVFLCLFWPDEKSIRLPIGKNMVVYRSCPTFCWLSFYQDGFKARKYLVLPCKIIESNKAQFFFMNQE